MSQPLEAPQRPAVRRRRRPWILLIAAGLTLISSLAYGSYQLGKRYNFVDIWDPLMFRVYTDRPIDTTMPGEGFWVSGYYVDYDKASLEVIKRSAGHMDQIVIFGYGFDRQGNLLGSDHSIIKGITGPQKRVLLFGNLTDGNFNQDTAHAILTDREVQNRAIQGMLDKSTALEAAGIQIDFENIPDGDRDAYTAFLKRLADELHQRKMTLSIAAAAKTRDTRTGWGGATDYVAIGQIVDHFYIMAYDEHWRGGEPGPVASLGWVEKVIRYATGVMPAQKVLLGLPFYGYEWSAEPNAGTKTNKAFGSSSLSRRAATNEAKISWDPVAGENVATYKTQDGERIAWFPDEKSLDAKLRLAYQYNLKGVAIWRLGFEPDEWWHQLGSFRLAPKK